MSEPSELYDAILKGNAKKAKRSPRQRWPKMSTLASWCKPT